jgi:hypothetical protein
MEPLQKSLIIKAHFKMLMIDDFKAYDWKFDSLTDGVKSKR